MSKDSSGRKPIRTSAAQIRDFSVVGFEVIETTSTIALASNRSAICEEEVEYLREQLRVVAGFAKAFREAI